MDLKNLYREIVNEHNLHPTHKQEIPHPDITLRGVNPSCGDDITLSLSVDAEGVITDGGFTGAGCAISQASVDMMLDQIIGRKREDALRLAGGFMRMIHGEGLTEEELEELDEAAALQDIAHMPARAKCAVLGWRTLRQALGEDGEDRTPEQA
ncbi:MAG: SUF system NifU family Fe-S cluster assembly protein [Butyrivibrio sp.]|nr:SUF system NifU family Fe-S cluster assembly protein [Butyrivibrio sp.]